MKTTRLVNRTEQFLDYYENRIKEDREASFFVFLTALSKDSEDPQNVFMKGDSSIGKTWVTTNVLSLFEGQDVWMLGGLSPTALVHSYGELVDANGDAINWEEKPTKKDVETSMLLEDPGVSKAKIRKEYFERLKKWNEKLRDSRYIVDMTNKLLVFLDAPNVRTFNALRPILSHDEPEISYRFADKDKSGSHRTTHVVIRGWPATIFCTTSKSWMEDLATRSVTVTPKTTKTKLRAACILIGEDAAFPINDYREQQDAKMRLELQCLQSEIQNNKMLVAIPFWPEIGNIIPIHQPRIMRDFRHIAAYIKLNALVNHKYRATLTFGEKTVILANYEDFITVMTTFEYVEETTITGLRKSIINVFNKAMVPLGSFTYSQLVDKCVEVLDRPLSESTLRDYVSALGKVSYVSEEKHPTDKRMKFIRVIKKQEENLSYSVRKQFSECFKLDSFKEWLKRQEKYSVVKPEIHSSKFNSEHGDDVESIFNHHYVERKFTTVNSEKKTEYLFGQKQTPLDKTSVNICQNYKVTEKDGIKIPRVDSNQKDRVFLTPVQEAEKCELCGQWPVKWQFIQDGEKVRRCQHCIDKMKREGMKFTTLRETPSHVPSKSDKPNPHAQAATKKR